MKPEEGFDHLNPFKPNELSYPYRSDKSILNFRMFWWYF